jgi:copper(I)-binding protein
VLYPFGTRREDWVHDLPLLLGRDQAAMATGAPRATAEGQPPASLPRPVQPAGAVRVVKAFVTRSRMAEAAGLYAVIENPTSSPEALIAVDAPAQRTELHETVREGEGAGMRMRMRPVAQIEVPAGGEARLAPGGYHVMLLRPALEWVPGDAVTAIFRFASGAMRTVQARVVAPDDVARLLDDGRSD